MLFSKEFDVFSIIFNNFESYYVIRQKAFPGYILSSTRERSPLNVEARTVMTSPIKKNFIVRGFYIKVKAMKRLCFSKIEKQNNKF